MQSQYRAMHIVHRAVKIISDPKDISNNLNSYFSSVGDYLAKSLEIDVG